MIDTAFSRPGHGLQNASSLVPADCLQAELVILAHGFQARHQAHWTLAQFRWRGLKWASSPAGTGSRQTRVRFEARGPGVKTQCRSSLQPSGFGSSSRSTFCDSVPQRLCAGSACGPSISLAVAFPMRCHALGGPQGLCKRPKHRRRQRLAELGVARVRCTTPPLVPFGDGTFCLD